MKKEIEQKKKEGKIVDLFDAVLPDETYTYAWRENEIEATYFTIGPVRICMPNQVFEELCKIIADYYRKSHPNKLAT